jgi:hypothetical protein
MKMSIALTIVLLTLSADARAQSTSANEPTQAICVAPPGRDQRASAASVLGAAVRRDRRARAEARDRPIFIGILIMVLIGIAKFFLRKRLARRHLTSLDIVMIVIGFVLLLMMRLPVGKHAGWIGALLFIGLAALYRLLGHIEEPAEEKR